MKTKLTQTIGDYVMIAFGALLYVVGWTSFLIPNNIASGGLTGACTIIQLATGGAIPVAYSFPVINTILIVLASLVMGKGFGFKTIFAIIVSTILFDIMPKVDILISLEGRPLYISEKVLIPIIGGLVEALGIGIILERGGSTGGTDLLAVVINKFWPVSLGKVYIFCDLVIIASILLIPGRTFQDMVYGYIAMLTFSLMVDFVLLGRKSTVQVLVFSEKYEDIADYIIKVLDRGVTALNAVGWYTKSDKKVLLIIVRKSQLHDLTKAVKAIDNRAFVSVAPANSVYGEGFEEMKTGVDRKKKQK